MDMSFGQVSLAFCSPLGHKESDSYDWATEPNWWKKEDELSSDSKWVKYAYTVTYLITS